MASSEENKWRAISLKATGTLSIIIIVTAIFIKPPKALDTCNSVVSYGQWVGEQWYPYQCLLSRYHITRVLGDCVNGEGTMSRNVLFIGEKSLLKYFKIIGDEISNSEIPDLAKEMQKNIPLSVNVEEKQFNSDYLWTERLDQSVIDYYENNIQKLPLRSMPTLIVHQHFQYNNNNKDEIGGVSNSCNELVPTLIASQIKVMNKAKENSAQLPTIIMLLYDQKILSEDDRKCQSFLIERYNEAIGAHEEFAESVVLFNLDKSRKEDQGIELIVHFICKESQYGNCCINSDTSYYSSVIAPALVVLIALYCGLVFVRATGTLIPLEPYFEGALINLDYCYYVINLIGTIFISLFYAVATDRMGYFVIASPWQSFLLFFLISIAIVCLGFMKRETVPKQSPGGTVDWLPREQIIELRGVSVLVMMSLEYSYISESGAGSWVWLCMVGLISCGTAYESFNYYFNNNDYSINKLIKVLFRYINLVIWFCIVLHSSVTLYTVPFVISQTILVVYFIMAVPPRVGGSSNNKIIFMLKLVFNLIILLIISAVEFYVTRGLGTLSLNRQLWMISLIVRILSVLGVSIAFYNKTNNSSTTTSLSRQPVKVLISISSFIVYLIFLSHASVTGYNQLLHLFLVSFVVLGYLILRNFNDKLKSSYSFVYKYVGSMSIELYVLFQHIMLSYNGKGLVYLFPSYYSLNLMATLLILVFLSLRFYTYSFEINNSEFYLPEEEEEEGDEEEARD